jgi:hypothetical protein
MLGNTIRAKEYCFTIFCFSWEKIIVKVPFSALIAFALRLHERSPIFFTNTPGWIPAEIILFGGTIPTAL